ncbi:hypothetical protein Ancab_001749, partial [Ancistrocladus abbreviatus]
RLGSSEPSSQSQGWITESSRARGPRGLAHPYELWNDDVLPRGCPASKVLRFSWARSTWCSGHGLGILQSMGCSRKIASTVM